MHIRPKGNANTIIVKQLQQSGAIVVGVISLHKFRNNVIVLR